MVFRASRFFLANSSSVMESCAALVSMEYILL